MRDIFVQSKYNMRSEMAVACDVKPGNTYINICTIKSILVNNTAEDANTNKQTHNQTKQQKTSILVHVVMQVLDCLATNPRIHNPKDNQQKMKIQPEPKGGIQQAPSIQSHGSVRKLGGFHNMKLLLYFGRLAWILEG